MGASQFSQLGQGKSVEQAFNNAHASAGYEYGHGYSGSLAEKDGYVLFSVLPGFRVSARQVEDLVWGAMSHLDRVHRTVNATAEEKAWEAKHLKSLTTERRADERKWNRRDEKAWKRLAEVLGEYDARRIVKVADDKWGAAAALFVGKVKGQRGVGEWLFFGMASS